MNLIDYLNKYKDVSLKKMGFNEIDALALADFSYVALDELGLNKEKISGQELKKLIDDYHPTLLDSERKKNYLKVASIICGSSRFKNIHICHYRKINDKEADKQFQAVTLIFSNIIYISYCGTDATILGWKEDFNMAILETVPSEIEAVRYANMVMSKHWFKKVYLGGHSKGGRLAISAAKGMMNKRRIAAIFSFDAPNYPSISYDEEYKKIDPLILAYAPNESIIGRLMHEYHQKRIIKSTNSLLMQHDTFSWLIDDYSFTYESEYTEKSSRIVRTINNMLINNDEETKRLFIDTLFDYLEKIDVNKLPNEKELVPFFIKAIPGFIGELIHGPKEKRSAVRKIVVDLIKDYFFNK